MASDASDLAATPLGSGPAGRSRRRGLARSRLRVSGGELSDAAGLIALCSLVLASILVVSLAAARPSFLSPPSQAEFPLWMSGPLGVLSRWYVPGRLALEAIFSAAALIMLLAYVVVLARAQTISLRAAIGAILALHLVFLLSPPLPLTDIFNYLNYGRMEAIHHLNPYSTVPVLEPHNDPSYLISNWHHLLSPYGPLFTLFTIALVPLGVAASFWVLKVCLAGVSLLTLVLIWRCARLLGRDPLRAILLVGLNPVVLVWGLGGQHNDAFMIVALVLAVYLLLAEPVLPRPGRALGAGAALAAAVAVKASAAVLLPVMLLGGPQRRRLLAGVIAGAAVLGVATLIAFGPTLPDLGDQSSLVTAYAIPNLLGIALGSGGETDTLKTVLGVVLALSVIGTAIWTWRSREWLLGCGLATIALLLTLSWTLPWYVLWLLPFAALAESRRLRIAALAITAYLLVTWLPLTGRTVQALGLNPAATHLARAHQAQTKVLLH